MENGQLSYSYMNATLIVKQPAETCWKWTSIHQLVFAFCNSKGSVPLTKTCRTILRLILDVSIPYLPMLTQVIRIQKSDSLGHFANKGFP